jgi:hypothetical protein
MGSGEFACRPDGEPRDGRNSNREHLAMRIQATRELKTPPTF